MSSDTEAPWAASVDTLWVSISSYLVLFMQAGFSLMEVGAVRAKNAQNILLKNIIDITIATMTWWLIGYGIAWGYSSDNFAGSTKYGGDNLGRKFHYRDWLFQWGFSGIAAAIVSGALAERTQILAYALFSFMLTSFIYPFVVHWCWNPHGWLQNLGYLDFAGSGVIHTTGGISALIGAIMVGPRIGRFDKKKKMDFRPHNIPLLVTGVFVLWFGWYGFNCGSTLGISSEKNTILVSTIGMNTSIGASSGGIFGVISDIIMQIIKNQEATFKIHINVAGPLTNGILAGLVSITGGCAYYEPYAAFIVGSLGGCICYFSSNFLQKLKIDDPLDAFCVHAMCGMWGIIMIGFFHSNKGIFYGGGGRLLGVEILAIIVIVSWTLLWATIIFGLMKYYNILRVSKEAEEEGLDESEAGGMINLPKSFSTDNRRKQNLPLAIKQSSVTYSNINSPESPVPGTTQGKLSNIQLDVITSNENNEETEKENETNKESSENENEN